MPGCAPNTDAYPERCPGDIFQGFGLVSAVSLLFPLKGRQFCHFGSLQGCFIMNLKLKQIFCIISDMKCMCRGDKCHPDFFPGAQRARKLEGSIDIARGDIFVKSECQHSKQGCFFIVLEIL